MRTCPICPGESLEYFYSGTYTGVGVVNYSFSLLKCPKCELHAVDPMPSNEVYPVSKDENGVYRGSPLETTNTWNIPLLRNVQKYKKSGDLLDLGCNAGDFMAIAEKNGFRCTGYEIDETA